MKLIKAPPVKKNLTIEFTPDELQVLMELVGNTCGNAAQPFAVDVFDMLKDSGYEYGFHKVTGEIKVEFKS